MKSRAAIAWEAGKPLEVDMVDLEGPKTGEVLIRNVATGVCPGYLPGVEDLGDGKVRTTSQVIDVASGEVSRIETISLR